jgi:imidazolonepropionase-like amidohydrolase
MHLAHEHRILIKNVSIFDGQNANLITGKNVILHGNKIEGLVSSSMTESSEEGYQKVIDGKGGYLTPGLLIDCHWHTMFGISANGWHQSQLGVWTL